MDIKIGEKVTSDVRVTWGAVLNNGPLAKHCWAKKKEFPNFDALKLNICDPDERTDQERYTEVVIREHDPEQLREMRSWLDEHARRAYTMFSRIVWSTNGYVVNRRLDGFLFKFQCPNVAMFFKMRWYQAPVSFG